jgi:hypothetical protein
LFGEFHVRFFLPAAAVSLCCLMPLSLTSAVPPTAAPPTVPTKAPATTAPAAPPADGFAAAAAARHAKRTACLKEAKAKKLVGASKNAYVQDCLAH